jgi:plasmid rolling circle replication initiator protein Rep
VHKFKGGESEVVFIPGLNEEQWNPNSNSDDLTSTLYVALTRAKKFLHLSWSAESRINGQTKPVHRLNTLETLPIEWTKSLTRRDEIEEALKSFPTLSEKTQADLAERKHATERIAKGWEMAGDAKKANKILGCSSLVVYEHYQSDTTGKERWMLEHADFCMLRTCLVCNWRRSVRNRMKLEALVNYIFTENYKAHPKLTDPARLNNPLFLTLTIPSIKAENLKDAIKLLLSGWRTLTRNGKRSQLWSQGLVGFWRSIEITRNEETGLYHPHLHVFMLATNAYYSDPTQKRNHSKLYMSSEHWAQKWTRCIMLALGQKATKSTDVDNYITETEPEDTSVLDYYGETKSTDVDKPREQFKSFEIKVPGTTNAFFIDVRSVYRAENRHSAIAEVTKYVTKDESMLSKKLAPDELVSRLKTLDDAIYRVRLVEDGGIIDETERTVDMETLINALLDGDETWTKLGESSFTYLNDRDYHETAEANEENPDEIDFLD